MRYIVILLNNDNSSEDLIKAKRVNSAQVLHLGFPLAHSL
jgi:hypothetical protein